jgi:hypothetical protein
MLGFITTFSCISSFLFGYDLGLMGGALLHIKQSMGTTDAIDGIIVGAAKLGAVLGTFLGGSFMLYYGRRKAIAVDSGFFLVGPIVMAFAWNVEGLVIGRLIVGMGIGISAVVVPAYLGEVSPAKVRGRVVELYEVMLCFGMLSAALVDAALDAVPGNWRWMVGAPAIPALVMAVAAMYLPESPRWLVTEGRLDEALAVMHKIHTSQVLPQGVQESTAVVEDELLQLWSSVEQDKAATAARLQEFERRRGGQGGRRWGESSGLRTEDGNDLIPTDNVDDAYQQQMHHRDAINSEKGGATSASPPPAAAHLVGIPAQLTRIRTSRSTDRLAALDAKANANAKAAPQRQEQSAHASDDRDAPETSSIALLRDAQTSDAPSVSHQQHRYSSHKEPATSNQQLRPTGCEKQLPQGTDSRTHDGDFLHGDDDVRCEGSSQQGGGASRVSGDPLEGFPVQRPPGFWAVAWNVLRDVVLVSRGPERSAFRMILILAFFNQAFASTAIINYAPTVLRRAGVSGYATAELLTSLIGASKVCSPLETHVYENLNKDGMYTFFWCTIQRISNLFSTDVHRDCTTTHVSHYYCLDRDPHASPRQCSFAYETFCSSSE